MLDDAGYILIWFKPEQTCLQSRYLNKRPGGVGVGGGGGGLGGGGDSHT